MLGRRGRRIALRVGHWTVVVFFSVILAFPFYWMLITAFKRTTDLYNLQNNPFIFNQKPTLDHLRLLFGETMFLRWFWNTALVGVIVVAITLLLTASALLLLAAVPSRRWVSVAGLAGAAILAIIGFRGSGKVPFFCALGIAAVDVVLFLAGFEALTDLVFCYHVTEEYDPADPDEHGIPWNDERIRHLWSTTSPILSERDRSS